MDILLLDLLDDVLKNGIGENNLAQIRAFLLTVDESGDFEQVSVIRLQHLLLLLLVNDPPSDVKNRVCRISDQILRGDLELQYYHGRIVSDYAMTRMTRNLLSVNKTVTVYKDGFHTVKETYNVQPKPPADGLELYNDYFQASLSLKDRIGIKL